MDLTDKRIIVTGGGGFLGRHVVRHLRKIGCHRIFVPRSSQYDLTDIDAIHHLLQKQKPEVIIHLAATVGGIGANKKRPASFLYENLIMGCQLMEYARLFGVRKFLTIGTTCSYPKEAPLPFKESDLWNGYPEETTAPYGLAKKMLIAQAKAYWKQYKFSAIHLLVTNLYGPYDNFDLENSHVIPALIRKCIEATQRQEPVFSVWGSGKATRDFLYVEEAARAIVLALEKIDTPDPINIGSGKETPIVELVNTIMEKVGFRGEVWFDAGKPDGQPRRWLDISLARKLLSFEPKVNLSEGLDRTITWYRSTVAVCGERKCA